jgi:DNA-binding NarL/FixJ family response regulator
MQKKIQIAFLDLDADHYKDLGVYFRSHATINLLYTHRHYEFFVKTIGRGKLPDVLFFSLNTTNIKQSLEQIKSINKIAPEINIVAVADTDTEAVILSCMEQGAVAFLKKGTSLSAYEHCIEMIYCNAVIFSKHFHLSYTNQAGTLSTLSEFQRSKNFDLLNRKEQQIGNLLISGLSYEEIAITSGMNINSVRYYIKKIYRTLKINNRTSAILALQK